MCWALPAPTPSGLPSTDRCPCFTCIVPNSPLPSQTLRFFSTPRLNRSSMLRLLSLLLPCACLTIQSSQAFLSEGPNGPLVIRHGGVYTGTFYSSDETRPCVRILTTEPVVLRNSYLQGTGHLIEAAP